jgi:hypothetical protein
MPFSAEVSHHKRGNVKNVRIFYLEHEKEKTVFQQGVCCIQHAVSPSGGTKENSQRSYLGINSHSVLTFSGQIG